MSIARLSRIAALLIATSYAGIVAAQQEGPSAGSSTGGGAGSAAGGGQQTAPGSGTNPGTTSTGTRSQPGQDQGSPGATPDASNKTPKKKKHKHTTP